MNKIYFIFIMLATLVYSDVNLTKINNNLLGIYKVTKHNCLKNLNGNSVCQDVTLYEFKNKVDDNKSNQMLLINWKSDYIDKFKLYYNAIYFNIDNFNTTIYPFTIIQNDGTKDNYIETIQFLDKNHGIKKAGFKKGLIEEVYFERISKNEVEKYKRLFPLSNKPIHKKGHITESYFERLSKHNQIFTYSPKDLTKKELEEIYGLKDINNSISQK